MNKSVSRAFKLLKGKIKLTNQLESDIIITNFTFSKNMETAMLKLLRYMRAYLMEAILAPAFKLLEASFELFVPLVVAQIIDRGLETGDTSYILSRVLVLVLLSFVGFAAAVVAQYFSAKAAVGFAARIRNVLFSKITSMSYSELDKTGTSTLITRMTSDVNQVQSGVNLTLRLFLRSPFIVFGAMVMAFTIDFESALTFAVMIGALSVVVFGIMLISIPLHRKVQENLDSVTSKTRENLAGVRILRGFRMEERESEDFKKSTAALEKAQKFVGRISALMNPLTFAIVNLSIIALIYVGGVKVDSGDISQGQVVALYNYMTQILVELVKLASLIITMTKAAASGQRISQVLESSAGERVGGTATRNTPELPKVEFRNVSFRYAGASEDSLSGLSFTAYAGETVGIIGATGSGKTTLVNLIPAFYEATEGDVLVDGVNVKDADLEKLREKFGIVPQKAVLFRGSIKENLLWRKKDASDAELMTAADTAQCADVIRKKSGELDAHVEQNGRNLSGGQRQRLTIARAIVGDPEILILDDSSSALDYATDAALKNALNDRLDGVCTFIVSQRTSSLMHADKIIVLEDGCPVGIGKHAELYKSCTVYREIHDLQFGAEGGNA